ncbi:hypothetical protein MMC07_006423 [Pseudocyphellaria aurata]|nr:hypothetical protein [Pseudocyphellaria aurata]
MANVIGNGVAGRMVANGKPGANGETARNGGDKSSRMSVMNGGHYHESSSSHVTQTITRQREITVTKEYRRRLVVSTKVELPKVESEESFLNFVANERLHRMPHRGSRWDKILRWAEYFAAQVSALHEGVSSFVPNSAETAQVVWASCRILLQMGPDHADALDKIFGVFYKIALTLASILRHNALFITNDATQDQIYKSYAELLTLVVDVTTTYQKRSRTTSSSSAEDFDSRFGRKIDLFFKHRDQVSNTIWTYQLERDDSLRSVSVDMATIRRWLAPQDRTLRLLSADTMNSRSARGEFTCEWFQSHLLEFSRSSDAMFLITGGSGTGKSILSGWIAERLERTLGRKSFDVNSVIIDSAIKSEATSLSVIKRLLLQSLEHNVGNVLFYEHLCTAFEQSTRANTAADIEEILWRAFDQALDVNSDVIIVVDGLDQMGGGENARVHFLDHLHEICEKHKKTKSIVLSRPLHQQYVKKTRGFELRPTIVRDDLSLFVEQELKLHHHFRDRREDEKQEIVSHVVEVANGCFTLADFAIQLLRKQTTHDGYTKAWKTVPNSISEALRQLVTQHVDLTRSDTKLILSWLLVSERPLTLKEIQSLLEINISAHKRTSRTINFQEQLIDFCGPLIEIRDDVVRLRHVAVRQHLLEISKTGKSILSVHDAHRDLMYRCLTYTNAHVTKSTECRMEVLEMATIDQLFEKHQLLEYTARYWTNHFGSSAMFRSDGKYDLTSEFQRSFASSVLLAQIEGACWESQTSITDAIEMHQIALKVRKAVLTETHESVLQSLITIARTCEKVSRKIEASHCFYEASRLSQTIIDQHSVITTVCAEAYVSCTSSVTTTTRTEITTRREEMLKLVIESHKHNHGFSSEETIRYSKLLAELYIEIRETKLAIEIYREVYEASVELYGEYHEETTACSRSLTIVLQKESRYEEVLIHVRSLFEKAETSMEVIDIRRVEITLRLVRTYEELKQFIEAEELIIVLWRQISEVCYGVRTVESHERKIQITIEYVKFLRRQSRYVEAENVLRGLWIEYESEDISSYSLILWIKIIGEQLNELRVLDVAVTVFRAVWSFFKKIHEEKTWEATSVAITIAKITVEIRSIESYSEEITSYNEETIIEEVYESTISTISTTTTATESTVRTCEALSSFYVSQQRWTEVIKICHTALKRLWLSFESGGKVILPKNFTTESFELAIRIAHAHVCEQRIERAEEIYVRTFRATISSLHIEDELVTRSSKELISFYESTNRSERAIEVYQDLWKNYSRKLGRTHTLTVKVLYRLGDLCCKYGRNSSATNYYIQIYDSFDHNSELCHHEAITAALALTRIYESEKRWSEAQTIYSRLWRTVLKRTQEYHLASERVEEIYRRYFYIMEKEVQVTYTVLRQTTIEFREVCLRVYGARAEITITATLRLAEINEQSEQHVHEAIAIYEETISETRTITTTTTITKTIIEAKARLNRIYVKHSSTSTEYSSKAVSLYKEQFEAIRTQYGCSHASTLSKLEELCGFYKSRNDQKLQTVVIRTLQETIVEIVVKEKDSRRLFDSSIRLAKIYVKQGYTSQGYQLLKELRRQVISRDTRSSNTCGFKINQQVDRRSFVFLVTFEETLKGATTVNFSKIMADFLTETIYHEAFTRSLTQRSQFESTLVHGARLRYFQRSTYGDVLDSKIDDEMFEAFQKNIGSSIVSSNRTTIVRYFFGLLLEETGKSGHEVNLINVGCNSGTNEVRNLLEHSKCQEAIDLATCVHQFVSVNQGYRNQDNISNGFKVALYLAGRGAKRTSDVNVRKHTLTLAKTITEEILAVSRQTKMDFRSTPVNDLNELVGLLGEVQNFKDLEWLLSQLWDSRHSQSWSSPFTQARSSTHSHTWSTPAVIWIGQRLVEVRFTHVSRDRAIRLLEDICYNLRRVWGLLDKTTLQVDTLRSELYTAVGSHAKAMRVHEEILQQITEDDSDSGSVDDRSDLARIHLDLLRRTHQRLGGWEKDVNVYIDLYDELAAMFRDEKAWAEVQPIKKWPSKGSANDGYGVYKKPTNWEFLDLDMSKKEQQVQHQIWLKRNMGLPQRWDSGLKDRKGTTRVGSGLYTFVDSRY